MAKTSPSLPITSEEYPADLRDKPAIGIIGDSATSPNELAGAVLNCIKNGHEVILTFEDDAEQPVPELFNKLPVTIIDSEEHTGKIDPVDNLAQVAREIGYPGLIFYETLSDSIDFDASTTAVATSLEYCVAAVPASRQRPAHRIVAGIPTYNEELGIGSVVHQVKKFVDHVVVIDDGSQDDTVEIARQAGAKVIRHDSNRGKGAAIQTLLTQIDHTRCDALVLIDGDGQHIPSDIPNVVEPILEGEADLVIGSRYVNNQQKTDTPTYRRVGQRILDLVTFGTSHAQVSDSQSGLRALSPAAIERIILKTNGFGAESEMIDAAVRHGLIITERPISVRYKDIDGHTLNPIDHGLEVVGFAVYLIRDRHPLLFFGIPGVVVTVAGILYGIDGVMIYQNTGQFYPVKVFTSGILTIVGILSLFVGLILNQMAGMIARFEANE